MVASRSRLAVVAVLTFTLVLVSLASTATYISKDSAGYIANHPVVLKVADTFSDTYKYIFDDDGVEAAEPGPRTKVYEDGREDAALFSLVRNSDLKGIMSSISYVETRFNSQYHYDWVFVNDEEFTDEFKTKVAEKVSGRAIFARVPEEFWSYPEWIDLDKAEEARAQLAAQRVKYGSSESYRFMCRFNSGFFYKMAVLDPYRYYWRVEPDIKFVCDIDYDPFKVMRENGKTYGFNMAMGEFAKTIPTLWDQSKEFFSNNSQLVSPANNIKFISDDGGDTYNMCHFWSNFEIADLDFFRSPEYEQFFQHLDHAGGFFYERWGDAPVHTIAASMMLPLERLQFFDNTGYFHKPNLNCPPQAQVRSDLHCNCDPHDDFTWHKWSCVSKFFKVNGIPFPDGVTPFHSKRDLVGSTVPDESRQALLFDMDAPERWSDEL